MDISNNLILLIQSIILIGQLVILYLQLHLSNKMNIQELEKNKGYLLIGETNYPTIPIEQDNGKDKEIHKNLFKFKNKNILDFYAKNSDVILIGSSMKVNNKIIKNNPITKELIFTLDERFNKLSFEFDLNDNYLNENFLDIEITFNLKNLSGYKYKQIINMEFIKQGSYWRLTKYNHYFEQ